MSKHINLAMSLENELKKVANRASRAAFARKLGIGKAVKLRTRNFTFRLATGDGPTGETADMTIREKNAANALLQKDFEKKLAKFKGQGTRPRLQFWEAIPPEKPVEKKLWER